MSDEAGDRRYNIRRSGVDPKGDVLNLIQLGLTWQQVGDYLRGMESVEGIVVDVWVRTTLLNTVTAQEWLSLGTPRLARREED